MIDAIKIVNMFCLFRGNIRKLCLPRSQKLTDKYSQALVGSQFIYPQLFVVIVMVDLQKTVKSLPTFGCVYERVFKPHWIMGVCLNRN